MISKIDKETLVVLLLICNTVKQTKILFFFLLAFLFVFAVPVFAQLPPDSQGRAVNDVVTESIIPPYPYPTSVPSGNPIFGQEGTDVGYGYGGIIDSVTTSFTA